MSKTSPTEAGQPERSNTDQDVLVDAINQVFGIWRINYHNQYYKAFPDADTLNPVKKLWLETLQNFSADVILGGAKTIVRSSSYLPSLHSMLTACEQQSCNKIPDEHTAYLEACGAPSPKIAFAWSHPAVYHAGQRTGWYFLSSQSEAATRKVFAHHYQIVVDEIRGGASLEIPQVISDDTRKAHEEIDKEAARLKIAAVRALLHTNI